MRWNGNNAVHPQPQLQASSYNVSGIREDLRPKEAGIFLALYIRVQQILNVIMTSTLYPEKL